MSISFKLQFKSVFFFFLIKNLNKFLKKRKYKIHKTKLLTAFLMTLKMTWWNCYPQIDLH